MKMMNKYIENGQTQIKQKAIEQIFIGNYHKYILVTVCKKESKIYQPF